MDPPAPDHPVDRTGQVWTRAEWSSDSVVYLILGTGVADNINVYRMIVTLSNEHIRIDVVEAYIFDDPDYYGLRRIA